MKRDPQDQVSNNQEKKTNKVFINFPFKKVHVYVPKKRGLILIKMKRQPKNRPLKQQLLPQPKHKKKLRRKRQSRILGMLPIPKMIRMMTPLKPLQTPLTMRKRLPMIMPKKMKSLMMRTMTMNLMTMIVILIPTPNLVMTKKRL